MQQFKRADMGSFRKKSTSEQQHTVKIDLTEDIESTLPMPSSVASQSSSSMSLTSSPTSLFSIFSQAKTSLTNKKQHTLSQSDRLNSSQSPVMTGGYMKAVCHRRNYSSGPEENISSNEQEPLVRNKLKKGVAQNKHGERNFDDCDLGFNSRSAEFVSQMSDVEILNEGSRNECLAPVQVFELQQKESSVLPTAVSSGKRKETVPPSDLEIVSSDAKLICSSDCKTSTSTHPSSVSLNRNAHALQTVVCCDEVTTVDCTTSDTLPSNDSFELLGKSVSPTHHNPFAVTQHRPKKSKLLFSLTTGRNNERPTLSKQGFSIDIISEPDVSISGQKNKVLKAGVHIHYVKQVVNTLRMRQEWNCNKISNKNCNSYH